MNRIQVLVLDEHRHRKPRAHAAEMHQRRAADRDAEARGEFAPGATLCEATAGNTGVGPYTSLSHPDNFRNVAMCAWGGEG